jgi:hypothetical protein
MPKFSFIIAAKLYGHITSAFVKKVLNKKKNLKKQSTRNRSMQKERNVYFCYCYRKGWFQCNSKESNSASEWSVQMPLLIYRTIPTDRMFLMLCRNIPKYRHIWVKSCEKMYNWLESFYSLLIQGCSPRRVSVMIHCHACNGKPFRLLQRIPFRYRRL